MSIVDAQVQQLQGSYPGTQTIKLPSGTILVTIPNVRLPSGWSKPTTTIRFLVPAAYPFAALDCFWADQDLRLADGQIPQAANISNQIPEVGSSGLWFSWHLIQPWNPNRDTLCSWMNTINDRLRRLQ